jgi:hypothetical protein
MIAHMLILLCLVGPILVIGGITSETILAASFIIACFEYFYYGIYLKNEGVSYIEQRNFTSWSSDAY